MEIVQQSAEDRSTFGGGVRWSEAAALFWYHGLRNCFITVAERDLLPPQALTKRLVNHARPADVTEGYAADWTIGQLRGPAQQIADRIELLMNGGAANAAAAE